VDTEKTARFRLTDCSAVDDKPADFRASNGTCIVVSAEVDERILVEDNMNSNGPAGKTAHFFIDSKLTR
jgi:hypothetical protein